MNKDFEILISALNGSAELYRNANLDCSCIIANQSDVASYTEDGKLKIITTNTRGLGKNRNISLTYSQAEYLLLGDDDVRYVENLDDIVVNEFKKNPKADILIFNIETVSEGGISRRLNNKRKRVRWYNYMNYGSVRIAFKRKKILQSNIWFSNIFGTGAIFSSGEDSLFLADCLKNKLKIYTVPITIGTLNETPSTWFKGYDKKYIYDKGALCAVLWKKWAKLLCILMLFRHKNMYKDAGLTWNQAYKLMKEGVKGFKKIRSYTEYERETKK